MEVPPILSDSVSESQFVPEVFFVDLSARSNAKIADRTGQCSIVSPPPRFTVTGGFDLSSDNATPTLGETVIYSIVWTVPDGRVWRDLKTIDFRIRDRNKTALWVRWEESTDLISLCQKQSPGNNSDQDDGNAKRATGVVSTPGDLPGSDVLLSTEFAELDLSQSSTVGSGTDGQTVTLNLAVRFLDKAAWRSFDFELAATDDLFNQDEFVSAGKVQRIRPRGPRK